MGRLQRLRSGDIRLVLVIGKRGMVLVRGGSSGKKQKQQVESEEAKAKKKNGGGGGTQLGKYELGKTLGEGNFGKVKYARDLNSGQPFAVKILEKNRIFDLKITDQASPNL